MQLQQLLNIGDAPSAKRRARSTTPVADSDDDGRWSKIGLCGSTFFSTSKKNRDYIPKS